MPSRPSLPAFLFFSSLNGDEAKDFLKYVWLYTSIQTKHPTARQNQMRKVVRG